MLEITRFHNIQVLFTVIRVKDVVCYAEDFVIERVVISRFHSIAIQNECITIGWLT